MMIIAGEQTQRENKNFSGHSGSEEIQMLV